MHYMPSLVFVYAEQFREAGSTVMRGFQLAELARDGLPGHRVRVAPLGTAIRNSSVFLTKGALKVAEPQQLSDLRRAGNRLLFDPVDEVPPPTTARFADVLVASSLTAFDYFSRAYPATRVALVNHHVDPRLDRVTPRPDAFRVGYFGETVNAILTDAIEERVDVVPVDTSREHADWLARVPQYTMHYAVRRERALDHFKPFLKGFTAAHSGAPVLIQRDQAEALRWLGEDYPYLVDAPVDEAVILDALARAEREYGGPRWARAREIMAGIRARTTPTRIVAELRAALA
jgi:hypothetical protein